MFPGHDYFLLVKKKIKLCPLTSAQSILRSDTKLEVHESFLRRVGRRTPKQDRLKLFTTNYDRCFEQAAHQAGFVVIDGFSFTEPTKFEPQVFSFDIVRRRNGEQADEPIDNLFHLYKIHGSIDWTRDTVTKEVTKQSVPDQSLLVYPRSTKFDMMFEQPHLEMFSTFQANLRESDAYLLVVGYGFNDTHVSESVMAAVKKNLSLNVVLVSPSLSKDEGTNDYVSQLSTLIDFGDARLTLIESTFEEFVPKLPDISGLSDLEKLEERFQLLKGHPLVS